MTAMFNKTLGGKTLELDNNEAETIIGKSVKIEGEFNGEGNVVVEGEVQGNLKTNKNLTVKPGAVITADTEAKNMVIAGTIEGNVKCHETLEVTDSGKILGDIETNIIAVQAGAIIKGQVTTTGNSNADNIPSESTSEDTVADNEK